ncbi:uncharacterized protein BDZ99DRAFT_551387 [Mytilinidion resinicola]|uniref:Uncharacterized protein n=1 Tax=Mytilinidion resinicola TaxID=574789 RepID=A0A6A6Y1Y2_9PEZI|nr:uncharacterized protein BDZ99DRAFT_551387 [Mytilinidion resinicola]KAF2802523.1 hypothetical protein BDZ99DRAFT_551387 [Mytilinidion resinicola]
MYPCMLQAVHDHGIGMAALNFSVSDFSRAGIEFPFLDLLGDGFTSFRWASELLMTASNAVAISGTVAYGTLVHPATFEPTCDAYAPAPEREGAGATTFGAASVLPGAAGIKSLFKPLGDGTESPYSEAFWRNVTNQPSFANGLTCDEMVRYFNTSVSTGENAPVPVRGRVEAKLQTFKGGKVWKGVYGIRLDTSFVENNYLSCESLRGYGGRT